MTYRLRQSRDGAIEFVEQIPPRHLDGKPKSAFESFNWETALLWYVRTLAWVWVGKGLFNWAIILGVFPGLGSFMSMTLALQATIVAFACFDLLAGVGLWLAAPWGGAIWLLCAVVEAASPILESEGRLDRHSRGRPQRPPRRRLLLLELAGGARTRVTQVIRGGSSVIQSTVYQPAKTMDSQ